MDSTGETSVLLKADGVMLGSTFTDPEGHFMFNGVLPGVYEVEVRTDVDVSVIDNT